MKTLAQHEASIRARGRERADSFFAEMRRQDEVRGYRASANAALSRARRAEQDLAGLEKLVASEFGRAKLEHAFRELEQHIAQHFIKKAMPELVSEEGMATCYADMALTILRGGATGENNMWMMRAMPPQFEEALHRLARAKRYAVRAYSRADRAEILEIRTSVFWDADADQMHRQFMIAHMDLDRISVSRK